MKQCSRCILSESFPRITFDDEGVCNYCRNWDKKWMNFDYQSAEQEMVRIFETAKSKKRRYDCLIPFSGGRDSTYVAYLCKSKYGLNPLLVTFNNLFMSKYALNNISDTTELLGVDHLFVTYNPDILKQFYKAMVLGGGEFCSICTAGINYSAIAYQRAFDIPLVIYGTSSRVDEQSPFEVTSTHPVYIRRVLKKAGFHEDTIDHFLIQRPDEVSVAGKILAKLRDADFFRINMPDYIQWNNDDIQQTLVEELDWQSPDLAADHIDCKFASIKYYLKNKQIPDFIFKQEKYSQLIRDGQMSRTEVLDSMKKLLADQDREPTELQDFIAFLNLDRSDIDNAENVRHTDYITRDDTVVKESIGYRAASLPWKLIKRIRAGI